MAVKSGKPATSPTLWDILDFFPAIFSITLTGIYAILTGFRRTEKQAKTLLLHVGYAVFRKATIRLSSMQMQLILPPTYKIYDRYIKQTRQVPQSVNLDYDVKGHWIGDKNAQNVLIWYHGGGFALPANIGHFHFFERTITDAKAAGKSLCVFCPTYTLTPHASYPMQLRQAVECLRYVVGPSGRAPANVFLGGDSAGGNLVAGVLSHLAHPHPDIQKLNINGNLAGAVLVSPWTSMETKFPPDQIIDPQGDLITEHVGAPWGSAYLGSAKRDYYNDPSSAPADWFSTFPLNSALVLAGGNEILLPVIEHFVDLFKGGFSNVELYVGKQEGHVSPIYDLFLGDKTETDSGKRMKQWLRELL